MMNLSFGHFKGSKIIVSSGAMARPFTGMIKNSIFNILLSRKSIEGSNIADIFCGSGIAGLECLSLGAEKIFFIDNQVKSLKKNIHHLSSQKGGREFIDKKIRIINKKVPKAFSDIDEKIDIVFLDPPFPMKISDEYYTILNELLADDGILIARFCKKNLVFKTDGPFEIAKEKKYGDSIVMFIIKKIKENK